MSHFFYVLSPTLYISLLIGTSILVIHRTKNKIKLKVAPNAIILVYLRVFCYTGIIIYAFLFASYDQIFKRYDSSLQYLGFFIPLISGTVFIALLYANGFLKVKEIQKICKKIVYIDNNLVERGASFNDLKYGRAYRYQLWYYGIGSFVYLVIMASQVAVVRDLSFLDATSSMKFVTFFPIFVDFVNLGQYVIVVKVLKYRFQYVNKQIGSLNDSKVYLIMPRDKSNTRNDHPSAIEKIDNLMYIYDQLCDVGQDLNRLKGFQMSFSIGFKFILITFALYYSYWCIFSQNQRSLGIYWIMWAIYHLISLLHLTICCQGTTTELLIFSLHRLHRPLKFTALEIFNIDATLYLSIIGTVSAYLVIMLQFQDNTNQKNGQTTNFNNFTNYEL